MSKVHDAYPDGDVRLYFVDAHSQRIYRWMPETHDLDIIRDNPLDPVNLAFDKAENSMIVSYAGNGTVYALNPDIPGNLATLLKAQPITGRPFYVTDESEQKTYSATVSEAGTLTNVKLFAQQGGEA